MMPPGAVPDSVDEDADKKPEPGIKSKVPGPKKTNGLRQADGGASRSTSQLANLEVHVPTAPDVRRQRQINKSEAGPDEGASARPEEENVQRRKTVFYSGRDAAPPVLTLEDLDLEAMTRLTVTSRSPSPLSGDGGRWADQRDAQSLQTERGLGLGSQTSIPYISGSQASRNLVSPISPLLGATSTSEKAKRTYKQKVRKMKRVIDLYTYSPYFRKRYHFGLVRGLVALYVWVSLFVSIPLWSQSSQYTRGNAACEASAGASESTSVFFFHPVFWNLLAAAVKCSLATYLNVRKRKPRLRMIYTLLEHISLPGTLAYSLYFWGAHKDLSTGSAIGLAVNNHLVVPTLMIAETWVSKTPFSWEQAWEPVVYVVWQAIFVFIYAHVRPGCYLLPALNPDRNVLWISYPGVIVLYLGGFAMVFTLTQVRDHVAPCGQQVFPPAKYGPPVAMGPENG